MSKVIVNILERGNEDRVLKVVFLQFKETGESFNVNTDQTTMH